MTEQPKNKSLALTKKQKDLTKMFAGSSDLIKTSKPEERILILLVAKNYNLPAVCVNIMGGLPYINKDGLLYKLNEYEGANIVSLTSKGVQYAGKPGERAIFESTLVLKDSKGRIRTFNAIGEADNASVKLEAVKATPNLMAETRSVNRVISKAIKARILRELYIALGKAKGVSDDDRIIIEGAAQTTAEEMNVKPSNPAKVTRGGLIQLSTDKIMAETDPEKLAEYYDNIKKSSLYTPTQKKILQGVIAEQRKKIINGKETK